MMLELWYRTYVDARPASLFTRTELTATLA
jgi:hypothetical protein